MTHGHHQQSHRFRAIARGPAEPRCAAREWQSEPGRIPRRVPAGGGAHPRMPAGPDPGRTEGCPAARAGWPADHRAFPGPGPMTGFDHYLSQCQKRIEAHLDSQLQNPLPQLERLYAAMRYSVMGGGKRIRPVLAYASGEALGVPAEQVDPAAAAVELKIGRAHV